MSFHDVRFPTDISYGSSGGPGFSTAIIEVDSGAEERISLMYDDPKAFDGTDLEVAKYDERCRQVAVEMFYLLDYVKSHI